MALVSFRSEVKEEENEKLQFVVTFTIHSPYSSIRHTSSSSSVIIRMCWRRGFSFSVVLSPDIIVRCSQLMRVFSSKCNGTKKRYCERAAPHSEPVETKRFDCENPIAYIYFMIDDSVIHFHENRECELNWPNATETIARSDGSQIKLSNCATATVALALAEATDALKHHAFVHVSFFWFYIKWIHLNWSIFVRLQANCVIDTIVCGSTYVATDATKFITNKFYRVIIIVGLLHKILFVVNETEENHKWIFCSLE